MYINNKQKFTYFIDSILNPLFSLPLNIKNKIKNYSNYTNNIIQQNDGDSCLVFSLLNMSYILNAISYHQIDSFVATIKKGFLFENSKVLIQSITDIGKLNNFKYKKDVYNYILNHDGFIYKNSQLNKLQNYTVTFEKLKIITYLFAYFSNNPELNKMKPLIPMKIIDFKK